MATTHAPLKTEYTFALTVTLSEDDVVAAHDRARESYDEGEYVSQALPDEVAAQIIEYIERSFGGAVIQAGDNLDNFDVEDVTVQSEDTDA